MTGGETVKKIRITGGDDILGKKKRGRKSETRKANMTGGNAEPPASTVATVTDKTSPVVLAKTVTTVATVPTSASSSSSGAVSQTGAGQVKQVKLAPKKTKVILEKSQTRKATLAPPAQTRKVRLAISGIHKNIHKAKTIKNKAAQIPLEDIKKELKTHGLWKSDSKAPEGILRGIYADFQILREKAL